MSDKSLNSSRLSSRRSTRSDVICVDDPVINSQLLPITLGEADENSESAGMDLKYKIEDVPPWYLCIVLGFQHYLTMFGATASIPLVLAPALCLKSSDVAVSEILSTLFFVSGIVTITQSTFGIRLPIIQGGTFSFLVPAFTILSLPQWKCPESYDGVEPVNVTGTWNSIHTTASTLFTMNMTNVTTVPTSGESYDIWKPRMREIQGAIITASLFQIVIGMAGVMGSIMRFIGPLTISPTIALIGLSLFDVAAGTCSQQWGIACLTIFLIILFSQYLRNVDIPVATATRKSSPNGKKCVCAKSTYPVFKMFPVILAIMISWILCFILTVSGAFPEDNKARTDQNSAVLYQAKWFRIPYPFQWGLPTFTLAGTLGMLAGVIAGMLESIGDYYACARMSGAPPPPTHALNRGIFVEGLGCVLSGMFGSGTGTTSYSENIGAIGITKVGSRRVIQTAGCIMIILGMFGKFGALFVTIPGPIVGGVFMTMFGMIAAVGISNLQYVDLNSSRNLFIFGFSILIGLAVPKWLAANPGIIQTGVGVLDQVITVLLGTSMFLGGTLAFILDNTVPGTLKERGIISWRTELVSDVTGDNEANFSGYNIPFLSKCTKKFTWTRYIPICHTYTGYNCTCKKRRRNSDVEDSPKDTINKDTATTRC